MKWVKDPGNFKFAGNVSLKNYLDVIRKKSF